MSKTPTGLLPDSILGTDKHGNVYRLEGDYVIQFKADGRRVGYLCSLAIWERSFKDKVLP